MRAWTLGSGSSGNALVIDDDGHRVLIDCGFGPRALVSRLRMLDIAPESIEAVIVTHEHVDHAQGVGRAQHKWRWPVVATAGTLDAIGGIAERWRRPLLPGVPVALDGFIVEGFAIPHDAAAPAAIRLVSTRSGQRAGIAHDLGRVPNALREAFADLELLCVEANHDEVMLRNGPYPFRLQERIRGGFGHIDNAQAGAWLRECAGPATRDVVLLHLSEANNTPETAERAIRESLNRTRFRGTVRAAPRRVPTAVTGLNARRSVSVQLALSL